MAIPFLSDIKLNGNQIKELVVDHKSSSQPTSGYHGQLIFRTDENKIYINTSTTFNSPSWSSIAGDITGITAGNGLVGDATTGDVTIDVGPSKGISVSSNRVSVDPDDVTLNFDGSSDAAKLQLKEIADNRILGNVSGGSAVPTALAKADILGLINVEEDADVNVDTNITVTENNTTVTIASSTGTNDSIAAATTSKAGVMTKDDKSKLDGIAASANNYSLDLTKLNTVTSGMTDADTLTFGDSGNDTQVTIKGNLTVIGKTTTNNVETVSTSSGVIFEGSAADGHDATLVSVVASSSKTYTLPNIAGHIPILSNDPGTTAITATATELNYVDGVTSAIQTQIDGKQDTITGAASTIDDTNLTVGRALVSNISGKVAVSAVTSTELGYLDGVTSNVQTQLDAKEPAANKVTKKLSGSTATSYDITHGFGTQHVRTTVLDYGDNGSSATYEQVFVDVKNSTNSNSANNKITITFGVAPGTSQDYLVLIEKFPAIS